MNMRKNFDISAYLVVGPENTLGRPVADVIRECRERGVLVISAKEKVRLLPALNIPMPLLERAVHILKEVCSGGQEGI